MYSSVVWLVFFLMATSGSDPYHGTEVEQSAFDVHMEVCIDVVLCYRFDQSEFILAVM